MRKPITVSGYVKDVANAEALHGRRIVYVKENLTGISTNTYGFYSITLPEGKYTSAWLLFERRQHTRKKSTSCKNLDINIELKSKGRQMSNVTITDDRSRENIDATKMSSITLSIEEIKKLPAFMGEVDILKTITLLPGVQSARRRQFGILRARRRAGPRNLILPDGALVYNASHLFGFFSVFNGDAVKKRGTHQRRHARAIWRTFVVGVGHFDEGRQQQKIRGGRRHRPHCVAVDGRRPS